MTAAVAAAMAGLVAIGCGGGQEQADRLATTTVIATEAPAAEDLGASSASEDPGRESKADDRTRSKTRSEDGTGKPATHHARDAGVESGGGNSSSASAGESSSAQGDSTEDRGTPTHVSPHGAPPGPSGQAVQPGGGDSDAGAHPPSAPASAAAADGEEQTEASAPPQP